MQHAMDIDKCLRLSIFTGLIGCIMLVLTVNYGGQDNQTPSSSPIPLPFSSSSSSSGTTHEQHLSEPTIYVLQNQIEQSSSPTSSAQTQKNPPVVVNEEIVDEQVLIETTSSAQKNPTIVGKKIVEQVVLKPTSSVPKNLVENQKNHPINELIEKTLEPTRSSMENERKPRNDEKTDERCDIFDGNWVYDPKRSPAYKVRQCPFLGDQVSCQRNGRSDSEYEKWIWEAKGCQIPRFTGVDMLKLLRGKRVIVVGDSLNRNQWESLVCLLYSAIPSSRAHVDLVRRVFKSKDYKCSVEFYWSPFLVELDDTRTPKMSNNGSRILRLDKLSASARHWRGADVMVFNTGHWWGHHGRLRKWDSFQHKGKLVSDMEIVTAYRKAIRTWARWIDRNVDKTRTTVFFRSISPTHFGKQSCYNRTQPIMDQSYINSYPKRMTDIVERVISSMKTPVRHLNITKLSQYRADAHPSIYARKNQEGIVTSNCSHWCLPGVPDTWNMLLFASMVLDHDLGYISHRSSSVG